jgi:hypothetical protein
MATNLVRNKKTAAKERDLIVKIIKKAHFLGGA